MHSFDLNAGSILPKVHESPDVWMDWIFNV
jgi:hypothetical protein